MGVIKHKAVLITQMFAAIVLLSSCAAQRRAPARPYERHEFTRDVSTIDYSGLNFTPLEIDTASVPVSEKKAYTIMVYMNGSDLESEGGAATLDLEEMLSSGVDTESVNIIIFTGGTYRWQNNVVPPRDCVVWRLENDGLRELVSVGLRNMGDAGTLSGFVDFSVRSFPAERYGLIFWDHGGGSIAGYGHDELFNNGCLTLLEMDYALARSGLGQRQLEFIGFDACLMATVEMAVVASGYARYLIASEDLEPGEGWDYTFLRELRDDPAKDGAELGKAVADYYMDYYGGGTTDALTLSVTDLSASGAVMGAMGRLMSQCSLSLMEDRQGSFTKLSQRRYRTKTFGEGTRRDNDCDMVDIGDMARRLYDVFPEQSQALTAALEEAVVYNRHNSLSRLGGLSAFYIFGGKDDAENTMKTYTELGMSTEYTKFLLEFAKMMTASDSGGITVLEARQTLWKNSGGEPHMVGMSEPNDTTPALWPHIGGEPVCMYKLGQSAAGSLYAVPIRLGDSDADLIIALDDGSAVIQGTRREDGYIIQKGVDKLETGDTLSFYYKTDSGKWILSAPVAVDNSLTVEWIKADSAYSTRLQTLGTQLDEHFADYVKLDEVKVS